MGPCLVDGGDEVHFAGDSTMSRFLAMAGGMLRWAREGGAKKTRPAKESRAGVFFY